MRALQILRLEASRETLLPSLYQRSAHYRAVERALERAPWLSPGDQRSALDLAARVVAQHLDHRLPFQPGAIVKRRDGRRERHLVIGLKPAGYIEGSGRWWNYRASNWERETPWPQTLVWTTPIEGGRGYGQSPATDWTA